MDILIDIILKAGRSAVELSLFVLLPVMVVMLSLMRLLEAKGILDRFVARLAPLLRPFGLNGLGIFAALQINFVSFAAPMATLSMMEQRGTSDRHIAATLAMVFAMAQANATFPMLTMGLQLGSTLIFSLLGGLTAAAATYYIFGRQLSAEEAIIDETLNHPQAESAKGVLDDCHRRHSDAGAVAGCRHRPAHLGSHRRADSAAHTNPCRRINRQRTDSANANQIHRRRHGDDGRHGRNAAQQPDQH
jgi:spore maturation protein SpmB